MKNSFENLPLTSTPAQVHNQQLAQQALNAYFAGQTNHAAFTAKPVIVATNSPAETNMTVTAVKFTAPAARKIEGLEPYLWIGIGLPIIGVLVYLLWKQMLTPNITHPAVSNQPAPSAAPVTPLVVVPMTEGEINDELARSMVGPPTVRKDVPPPSPLK